jgi:hypothetical protein
MGWSGIEHVAGSMFESVPSGDAIFMKVWLKSIDFAKLKKFQWRKFLLLYIAYSYEKL